MILYDGLEDALIGTASVWHPDGSRVERAVYQGEKIVDVYMSQGMSDEEAIEFINYNTDGGYLGEDTPIITWEYLDDQ